MATYTRHVCFNIQGFKRNFKHKKLTGIFEDENGRPLNHFEATEFIDECERMGYKYFPNHSCEGFDPFEKGCPGHLKDLNDEKIPSPQTKTGSEV